MLETNVSALFVDPKGIYPQLVWDCWGKDRDARLYPGSNPVVAHPPCNLWVNYAALNYKRYGGEHNRPGNDGGCFERALRAVRNWGASSSTQQNRKHGQRTICRHQLRTGGRLTTATQSNA